MKKKEFEQQILNLLSVGIDDLEPIEVVSVCERILEKFADDNYEKSNSGKPWSDDELKMVLRHAPTKENIIRLARGFRRSIGSIEQIFRWATTPDNIIRQKGRETDSFIQQIKRVAKSIGWRA